MRTVLEHFCRNQDGNGAYRAIIEGAVMGVWVVQHERVTQRIDLHAFIRADLGHGALTLEELWNDERRLAEWAREMDDVDPWLARVQLELFWDPIAEQLPMLNEPLWQPGEPFQVALLQP